MEVQTHTEPWDLNTMICFVAYRLRQECNQRLAEYGLTYGPYLLGKLTNRCSAVGISPQPVGN